MFLLVSVRHVGAHPDEHQHGVSIQISINLGKTSQNVSSNISYTNYSFDLNLGEGLCICTSFHFPDSGLNLLNGFDFYFDLFWMAWRWKPAIESRQLANWVLKALKLMRNLPIVLFWKLESNTWEFNSFFTKLKTIEKPWLCFVLSQEVDQIDTLNYISCYLSPIHFFNALAASCMLYNLP